MAAGINAAGTEAAVIVANLDHSQAQWRIACTNLPWRGATEGSVRVVDAVHDFAETSAAVVRPDGTVTLVLRRPSVALISLRGAK